MFYSYCPNCKTGFEIHVRLAAMKCDSEIGIPIYYSPCKSCGYANRGYMLKLSDGASENKLYKRYINKHKNDEKRIGK